MSERIKVNRIRLVGPDRHYDVDLRDGINIVTGPISTGKSSVLKLIDYACGAQRPPSYPEISKCSRVYVEFFVGGEVITISRSLHMPTAPAALFSAAIDEVFREAIPELEIATKQVPGDASISSEILRRLGMANINVKTSPSREASGTSAFSLRDLMSLMYLDQGRVGREDGFFEGLPGKELKFRAAFEVVNNIFDKESSDLGRALHDALEEAERLSSQAVEIDRFLTQFKVPATEHLEAEMRALDTEEAAARTRLDEERATVGERMGENLKVAERRDALSEARAQTSAKLGELQRTLGQLGRLRVQYERERAQLEFLRDSESFIAELPVVRCPACLQAVEATYEHSTCYVCTKPAPQRSSEVSVETRLKSARRRIGDIDIFIEQLETQRDQFATALQATERELRGVNNTLQHLRSVAALPDTRRLMEIDQELSRIREQKSLARERLVLRQGSLTQGAKLAALRERAERLRVDLDRAKSAQASPERVLGEMSTYFASVLELIGFPNRGDAHIDRASYIPVVRGLPYRQLSSMGAISLAMISWYLALLIFSKLEHSRFPRFLMFDAPLSHVGHDSTDPEFRDQKIVEAFYTIVSIMHEAWGDDCQVIISDPRPPAAVKHLVALEFTGQPGRGRYGLIDDEQKP